MSRITVRRFAKVANGGSDGSQRRLNSLGIQMLSKSLYEQIFGDFAGGERPSPSAVDRSIRHLTDHGLWDRHGRSVDPLPDVDIKLPPLLADNIHDHFVKMASSQLEPYLPLINALIDRGLPSPPTTWNYHMGWTKYDSNGNMLSVPFPNEQALVFDVEVCVKESHAPVLAVGASPNGWYSWVSKRLIDERDYLLRSKVTVESLVPLGEKEHERLIVGHNVSYDRARIKEQYNIKNSKMRFLDTLSLHVCVAGQTAAQKHLWKSTFGKKTEDSDYKMPSYEENDVFKKANKLRTSSKWMSVSCPNGLSDVHQLHCGGNIIDKSARDIFVTGNITQIRDNFQMLMNYCCQDVICTHQVLQKIYPLFQHHCPHPVTLAGMLEMNSMYLPVNDSWNKFVQSARYTAEDMDLEMSTKLMSLANEACSYIHDDRYLSDVWLSNLDWSVKGLKSKKRTSKEMKHLMERIREEKDERDTEHLLISINNTKPKRRVHKPGYPEWYRQLCMKANESPWQPGPALISPNMRVVPYLLRMKWDGYPLYYHRSLAWGYIIPTTDISKGRLIHWGANDITQTSVSEDIPNIDDILDSNHTTVFDDSVSTVNQTCASNSVVVQFGCGQLEENDSSRTRRRVHTEFGITDDIVILGGDEYYYFKLPHKLGSDSNCGNPLSKDYLTKMQSGILMSSLGTVGQRILQLNTMGSFWRSVQKRIDNQFIVWDSDDNGCGQSSGVIIPLTMVAGTVTRRAVESTWLTASNAKENRIGSELKCMIQSPSGYCLVGADVDSQEIWIASILGDEHFTGIQGGTAFGWMNLQGSKSEGTDIHSKTAQTIGISREQAKVFNYGRIYGAGQLLSNMLLKQFNPLLSFDEIQQKSSSLYKTTKGERRLILSKPAQERAYSAGITVHDDGSVNQSDWYDKFSNDRMSKSVIKGRYWYGGTESHMFNKLESIATSSQPRTPVLNALISRSLQPKYVGNKFMTSRINWIVQSSAVDYLHLLLVAMKWLMEHYSINGRLCISIHDEVRYLIVEEDKYIATLALQKSNLWTRAMFAYQLGMNDLPLGVAFFSAVDIDTVLRKEVMFDCQTPSNPLGLRKGYGIEYGEAINITETINKLKQSNFAL